MIIVGITGSMGMGKSTVASVFACEGIPFWSADESVARLYRTGGKANLALRDILPGHVFDSAGIDRNELRRMISRDSGLLKRIEKRVHPLVRWDREMFLDKCRKAGEQIAVVEIPLLFESGGDRDVDTVIVVTAPPDIQRRRVTEGREISEAEFEALLSNQMPDCEKRQRADFVIESVETESTRLRVREILKVLKES